jgi:hypothetical protein
LSVNANDLRLDDNVIEAANHHEMFDIVPSHQHKLALSVEAERIDETEPRLTSPTAAWEPQSMGE